MSYGIRDFYAERSLSFQIGDGRELALYECWEVVPVKVVLNSENGLGGTVCIRLDDNAGNVRELVFDAAEDISFTVERAAPGFVNLLAEWKNGDQVTATLERSIGFSVEKIQPCEAEPEDFEAFWFELFAQADALPDEVRMIPVPDRETEQTKLYELHVPTLDDRTIYGYISIPKAAGKFPILICYPGSGPASGEQQWLRYEDAITLFMNVHSYPYKAGETQEETIARAGYNAFDYATIGIESRDTYVYHDVLPAMHRAVRFVQTLPEYDGENLGVFGSSQGGWLSIMTAAFHPEVKAVCANVPAFTQIDGFLSVRTEMAKHEDDPAYQARVRETLRYYSTAFAAKRIRAKVAVIVGRIDHVCPPTGIYAMFNALAGKKKICHEMDMKHECRASWSEGIQALRDHLTGK